MLINCTFFHLANPFTFKVGFCSNLSKSVQVRINFPNKFHSSSIQIQTRSNQVEVNLEWIQISKQSTSPFPDSFPCAWLHGVPMKVVWPQPYSWPHSKVSLISLSICNCTLFEDTVVIQFLSCFKGFKCSSYSIPIVLVILPTMFPLYSQYGPIIITPVALHLDSRPPPVPHPLARRSAHWMGTS